MTIHGFSNKPASNSEIEPLAHLDAEHVVAETLPEHLGRVASLATGFGAKFRSDEWARLAGLWHDLGKYSPEFQAYLRSANELEANLKTASRRVDHSTAGAQHAVARCSGSIGRLLAYCIAGHHGGLPDARAADGGMSGLDDRLKKEVPSIAAAPSSLLDQAVPHIPSLDFGSTRSERAFALSVFCRMLFSCLVDADYLATEQFMAPERAVERKHSLPTLAELLPILDDHLVRLQSNTPVNRKRRDVLAACLSAAEQEPGLFSLTVPTGGGKTLSSLAFALKHAVRHGLQRVIYAIPFTSIIEQNASVFRQALAAAGAGVVLEHHSAFEPMKGADATEHEAQTPWHCLAAENWDAPLVVTTNVQFYESLFASKKSRCRKLHNIAHSVIILDEAQSLPVQLLRPTLAMLEELCRNYGCTVVLCSATQPAVGHRDDFPIGLRDVREIITDVPELFAVLKRVEVEQLGRVEDDVLVERLARHEQVLCVVNTRKHAATLFELLRGESNDNVFHLSAQMCPAHRTDVLEEIRARLDPTAPKPCRVISTQLIEAGVDIDFPVVYRAMAGLDSIAQAAGRCNREGRSKRGRVFTFETDVRPTHQVKQAAQDTRQIAALHADLFSLDAIEAFFSLHYWQRQDEWDKHEIMKRFSVSKSGLHFQYREAAEKYRLIKDEQRPVIVPYGRRGRQLVEELKTLRNPPGRDFTRRLQRFVVGLYEGHLLLLIENGVIAQYHEQYWIVENDKAYDSLLGLRLDVVGMTPAGLIV